MKVLLLARGFICVRLLLATCEKGQVMVLQMRGWKASVNAIGQFNSVLALCTADVEELRDTTCPDGHFGIAHTDEVENPRRITRRITRTNQVESEQSSSLGRWHCSGFEEGQVVDNQHRCTLPRKRTKSCHAWRRCGQQVTERLELLTHMGIVVFLCSHVPLSTIVKAWRRKTGFCTDSEGREHPPVGQVPWHSDRKS